MGFRFKLVIIIFCLIYVALLFNLYRIQVLNNDNFLAKAESQYFSSDYLKANRGSIFFTDKAGVLVPAALNKSFPKIYAVPKEIEDSKEAANLLAPILNLSADELEKKFSDKNNQYNLLEQKSTEEIVQKVKNLKLKGIYVRSEPSRFYPLSSVAAQLVGFVGQDSADAVDSGRYGIEKSYNPILSGKSGINENGKVTPPEDGSDIKLTIDPSIQNQAEEILKGLIDKFSNKGGSVIVAEPKTGKILALANYPNFDPNNYGDFDLATFINPTVQAIYEPGSVFKVITMAAGLDAGKITPDTTFVDTGVLKVSGKKIQNWDHLAHGKITMTQVIEKSVNTGAAFAESKIGRSLFVSYLNKFGFSEKTEIDLTGEISGNLRSLSPKASDINYAAASFGQGVAVTPIELISAIGAIANGGHLMRPYLNSALVPKEIRTVIGQKAASQTTQMMVSALEKANVGKIASYQLAGKTGTAQVANPKGGGYLADIFNHTYVGFGPTSDPRFIILIKLNETSVSLAGGTVVPAFRELAQFILNYYNIPPDKM